MAEIWVALVKNNIVENTVVVESLEIAGVLFPNYDLIEINEETGYPSVGYEVFNSKFRPQKPNATSEWLEEFNMWGTIPHDQN
jgi:hypothetical protein